MYCPICGQAQDANATHCIACEALLPGASNENKHLSMLVPVNPDPASLFAGYIALFGILIILLGPIALALGLWGRARIRANPKLTGIQRAWTGIILGGLESLALLAIIAFMIF